MGYRQGPAGGGGKVGRQWYTAMWYGQERWQKNQRQGWHRAHQGMLLAGSQVGIQAEGCYRHRQEGGVQGQAG